MTDAVQTPSSAPRVSAWAAAGTTLDQFPVRMEGRFSWAPEATLAGGLSASQQQRQVRRAAQAAVIQHVARMRLSALLFALDGIEPLHAPGPSDPRVVSTLHHIRILSVRLPSACRSHDQARTLLALSNSLDRFRVIGQHLIQQPFSHTAT